MSTSHQPSGMVKLGLLVALGLSPWLAQASLQPRDLDLNAPGFEAYYDTELNITWLSDMSYIRRSGFDADGRVSWDGANSWIASLNQRSLYGFNDWRLPKVSPVNGTAFQLAETNNGSTDRGVAATGVGWGKASEMGHLYYVTLGNKGMCVPTPLGNDSCVEQVGYLKKDFGPFKNLETYVYWSGMAQSSSTAWYFYAYYGNQNYTLKTENYSALAVRDGDVAVAVPEPGSLALMALGLAGLVGLAKCRRLAPRIVA